MVVLGIARGPSHPGGSKEPDDRFLIQSMLGGDQTALRRLMKRYDRLVRYTVFKVSSRRCAQDPQWLESVASSTWLGFVRSLQRDPSQLPSATAAYLVQIARRQALSALRAESDKVGSGEPPHFHDLPVTASDSEEVIDAVARLEALEALRSCLAALDDDDRTLASQLPAITERRWREAAAALGMQESTLRSRWKRTLERLRRCLAAR